MLAERREGYDPYVATRLDGGGDIAAADYIAMHRSGRNLRRGAGRHPPL